MRIKSGSANNNRTGQKGKGTAGFEPATFGLALDQLSYAPLLKVKLAKLPKSPKSRMSPCNELHTPKHHIKCANVEVLMEDKSPALPVDGEADPSLGPPLDGWEYLKQVRWEANRLPNINVAQVRYYGQ